MPVTLIARDTLDVPEAVRADAAEIVREACDEQLDGLFVQVGATTTRLPDGLAQFLIHVLERTAAGDIMSLASMPEELTTTVAAESIGVSRPTLMKLINSGQLPAIKVGSHHRVRAADVAKFKHDRAAARAAAFEELRAASEELGEE
jgi:excisionase family DNA binding protein